MTIRLLDYVSNENFVDVGDETNIAKMIMTVLTGDEVLEVIYKDYNRRIFDSGYCRMADYFDGEYVVYDCNDPANSILNNEKFMNRGDSYWFERLGP